MCSRARPVSRSIRQSLEPQCLWITDDVLATAYQRFARLALSAGHQVRHGSNVPGPLEARRRLARRRMGMAACAAPMAGAEAGGSFWSFFKTSAWNRDPRAAQRFIWQPPSLPRRESGVEKENAWSDTTWLQALDLPAALEEHEEPAANEEPIVQVFVEPAEFADILQKAKAAVDDETDHLRSVVEAEAMQDLLRHLRLSDNGMHFRRTAVFLAQRRPTAEANRLFLDELTLARREKRITPKRAFSALLSLMLCEHRPYEAVEEMRAWLRGASEDQVKRLCRQTTRDVCTITSRNWNGEVQKSTRGVDRWLELLADCGEAIPTQAWLGVYTVLAQWFPSPKSLAKHLARQPDGFLAWILLLCWVPRLLAGPDSEPLRATMDRVAQTDMRGTAQLDSRTAFEVRLPKVLIHHRGRGPRRTWTKKQGDRCWNLAAVDHALPRITNIGTLIEEFRMLQAKTFARPHGGDLRVELLRLLKWANLPDEQLTADLFSILEYRREPTLLRRFYHAVQRHSELGVTPELTGQVIAYFRAAGELKHAFRVLEEVPQFHLGRYANLILQAAREGVAHPHSALHLLQRGHTRRLNPRRLTALQIHLVHRLAHYFARSTHLSARRAYRWVTACVGYLRRWRAKPKTDLSDSLVLAGIARFIKEETSASVKQTEDVLRFVRRVEGDARAADIHEAVQRYYELQMQPRAVVERLARERLIARAQTQDPPEMVLVRSDGSLVLERVHFSRYRTRPWRTPLPDREEREQMARAVALAAQAVALRPSSAESVDERGNPKAVDQEVMGIGGRVGHLGSCP